jgi:hypothetical protein
MYSTIDYIKNIAHMLAAVVLSENYKELKHLRKETEI